VWYKVLVARYGEVRGRLSEGGKDGSTWWKDLVGIRNGLGMEMGSWFDDSLRRSVENGVDTYFWTDS